MSGGSSLPNQSGNNGKYLTTNGSTASWANITIPSGIVTTSDVATVTNNMLAGSIQGDKLLTNTISNDRLVNSSITINGTSVALGGSITVSGSTTQTVNSSTSLTVNFNSGNFVQISLISNITSLTLSNAVAGIYIFELTQDSTGNRIITWPASFKWPGNVPPVLSTAAGKIDIITLVFDGSNYYGSYALNY